MEDSTRLHNFESQGKEEEEENPTLQRNVIYDRLPFFVVTFVCVFVFRRKRASIFMEPFR
jgi:hypothetical protein